MRKELLCMGLSLSILVTSLPVYASETPYEDEGTDGIITVGDTYELFTDTGIEDEVTEPIVLSVNDAVDFAIEHNQDLELLVRQLELADIQILNAEDVGEQIVDAKDALEDGEMDVSKFKSSIEEAEWYYENDELPSDIDDYEAYGVYLSQGDDITEAATKLAVLNAMSEGRDASSVTSSEIDYFEEQLRDEIEDTLEGYETGYYESVSELEASWAEYYSVIKDASREMEDLVNYSSSVELTATDADTLMNLLAETNMNVTIYAQDIYKNQIEMLIKKNYYDALYAKTDMELKAETMRRGETQYNIVKLSYENGMKAKDDYLLAKMYYDGTVMAHRLAEATYKNSLIELKTNMHMDLSTDLTLSEETATILYDVSLDAALASGLSNRLEIQSGLAELVVTRQNMLMIQDMRKDLRESYHVDEAEILYEAAGNKYEKTKETVASEVRQTYELRSATWDMLQQTETMVAEAEEVVEIAKLKYEQGFGVENSLLANLNLESTAGTIIELIAAEENLANIKSQVANVEYNFIMAQTKLMNDAAIDDENLAALIEEAEAAEAAAIEAAKAAETAEEGVLVTEATTEEISEDTEADADAAAE